MADINTGQQKLIQYLNEAYGTERRLEVALQAHSKMATRPTYKKRLRDHLSETKQHARQVSQRIKQLGGTAEAIDIPGPDALSDVAQTLATGAQRAVALAQGPMHMLRGTGEEEKQLKNAKTEFASEAEEIATYSAIIALADALGDRQTVQLARSILRQEERMASFLQKEIPRMTTAVVRAEVPRSERASSSRTRSRTTRRRTRGEGAATGSTRAARSRGSSSSRSSRSRAATRRGSSSSASRSRQASGASSSSRNS